MVTLAPEAIDLGPEGRLVFTFDEGYYRRRAHVQAATWFHDGHAQDVYLDGLPNSNAVVWWEPLTLRDPVTCATCGRHAWLQGGLMVGQ